MAKSNVIRSFLVGLGFKVDEASRSNFKNTVEKATKQVKELGKTVKDAAITAAIARIAQGFEQIYFASKRIGASAGNIEVYGQAIGQLGGSADEARESLESLARNLRNAPGNYGLLESLGVRTRATNGQLRDSVAMMVDLGHQLRQMPMYRANAYAQALGIDERTLLAMRSSDFEATFERYVRVRKELGLSSNRAADLGRGFMMSLRNLWVLLQGVFEKLSVETGKILLPLLQKFQRIMDGLLQRYSKLDQNTKNWIGRLLGLGLAFLALSSIAGVAIKGIGIAWKLMGLTLLRSPLGVILALAAAFALLADDYMVWKRGGKSAIDWSKWSPEIEKTIDSVKELASAIDDLWKDVQPKLKELNDLVGFKGVSWDSTIREIRALGALARGDFKEAGAIMRGEDAGAPGNAVPSAPNQKGPAPKGGKNAGEPRGIRNNNPGNVQYSGLAKKEGGTLENHANPRFAAFPNAQAGLNVLAMQLKRYANAGIDTLRKIIAKYAPSIENNTKGYIASVAKRLGVDPDKSLNLNDPKIMQGLMDSIVRVENGKNPYSSDMMAKAAQIGVVTQGAFGDRAPVTISPTTHINVQGVSDPERAANLVADNQRNVNEKLGRRVQVAMQ